MAIALAVLAIALGVWQLGRASDKQAMMDLRSARQDAFMLGRELRWRTDIKSEMLDQQRVTLQGQWLGDASVALDNRAWEGRPGVHVLTPMRLADGSLVWVNRGWAPKAPGVTEFRIPQPDTKAALIEGVALASVMRRMELSSDPASLRQGNLWQNFDWDVLAAKLFVRTT